MSTPVVRHRDLTFRNYTPSHAKAYAIGRSDYPNALIKIIVDAHITTSGQLNALIDLGCGPGIATRQLAPYFQHATGVDPGEAMVQTARSIQSQLEPPVTTASGEQINFEIGAAETIHTLPSVAPGSIDLITAANAAHWFDMPAFYVSAAKILKPGGSIILFTAGQFHCDPLVTPNAAELQRLWKEWRTDVLGPYQTVGNGMTETLYSKLEMPWQIATGTDNEEVKRVMGVFDQAKSKIETFNEDGKKDERFENGYLRYMRLRFEQIKAALETLSPVTRWREAHREQLERGEVEDVVDALLRVTRETMEAVPEGKGVEELAAAFAVVVVVIKKKVEA